MYKTTKMYEKDGFVYLDEKSKQGTPVRKYCFRAVSVTRIFQNLTSKKIDLEISYDYNGKTNSLIVSRSVLTRYDVLRTFPEYGIDVNDLNVNLFLDWISVSEQFAEISYIHKSLGWVSIEDQKVYLHEHAVSKDGSIQSIYGGEQKIHKKGTLAEHLELIATEVKGNSALEFSYIAGISAILIGFIKDFLNIPIMMIHFYGNSSTGKTSALQLSLSPFGLTSKARNGLMLTWNSTQNAIMGFLRDKIGFAFAVDESSSIAGSNIGSRVYALTEGLDKGRANIDGSIQQRSESCGTFFSTGEGSLLQDASHFEGLRVRLIELSLKKFTSSAENSKNIQRGLEKSYGHTAPIFAEYLLNVGEAEVVERFKKAHDIVMSRVEHTDSMTDRVADRFAIIYLTGLLVNECLHLGFDIDSVLDLLISVENESVLERDLADKAYRAIIDYVTKNPKNFYRWQKDQRYKRENPYDETVITTQEIKGRVDLNCGKATAVSLQKDVLFNILRDDGFGSPLVAIRSMKDKNMLVLDKSGKLQVNRRLYPTAITRTRVYCIRIDDSDNESILPDDSENETFEVVKMRKSQRKQPASYGKSVEELFDEES